MSRGYFNHRKIWISHYGIIPMDERGKSYDIHHIDGNRRNNAISNLMCVSIQDHFDIHFKQGNFEACKAISLRISNMFFSGYKMSEETKRKCSKSKLGDLNPAKRLDVRKKISESLTGRKIPKEVTEKRLKSRAGYRHSEETRNKMKKPKEKVKCPWCDKQGGISTMHRWHFNNCKSLNN
jgi:hypothetical protein